MARLNRVAPIGIAQHIIQRGNNRQICFSDDGDMQAYVNWLKIFSKQHQVSVHAWVLMTNHVHLLCTPHETGSISKMIQSLGRMYVQYFNRAHERSGTLWEGRYRSCLVQSENYLLELYRYIELNPVRAGMVDHPNEYRWSSYGCNALGINSTLRTPHEMYLLLGVDAKSRQENYRSLFQNELTDSLLKNIRYTVNRGLALGGHRFADKIEILTAQRVTAKKAGRPKKATG